MGSRATGKRVKAPSVRKINRGQERGETMNATPNANSLAAAFAHAFARGALHGPIPVTATVPAVQPEESQTPLTPDELLLTVLRHNLSPADKIMARRTLLRAAP